LIDKQHNGKPIIQQQTDEDDMKVQCIPVSNVFVNTCGDNAILNQPLFATIKTLSSFQHDKRNNTALKRKLDNIADTSDQHNSNKGNKKRVTIGTKSNTTTQTTRSSPTTTTRNSHNIINNAPEAETTNSRVARALSAPISTTHISKKFDSTNRTRPILPESIPPCPIEYVAHTETTDTDTGHRLANHTATYTPPCTQSALQPESKHDTYTMRQETTTETDEIEPHNSVHTLEDLLAQCNENTNDDDIPCIKQMAHIDDNIWDDLSTTASAISKFLSTTSSVEVVYTQEQVHAWIEAAHTSIGDNVRYDEAVFQKLDLKSFNKKTLYK
jgi:Asp-tRNA(Asn)/Glu-tRNA(Gln) amidotransferase C subunit